MKDIITLGIESSCDETSVAVVKNGREVLSNVIDSQIKIHEKYGGVVPEIASRNHIEAISRVTKTALKEANINFDDIDVVSATYGPRISWCFISWFVLWKILKLCNKQAISRSKSYTRTYSCKLYNT